MPSEVMAPEAHPPKEDNESIPDEYGTGKWANTSETDDATTPYGAGVSSSDLFGSLKREKTLAAFCKPRRHARGAQDENGQRVTPVGGADRFNGLSR